MSAAIPFALVAILAVAFSAFLWCIGHIEK